MTPQGVSGHGTKHRSTPEGQTGNPWGPPPKRPDPRQPIDEPAERKLRATGVPQRCRSGNSGFSRLKTAFFSLFARFEPPVSRGLLARGAFEPHGLPAIGAALAGSGGPPVARTPVGPRSGKADPLRVGPSDP